MKTLDDDLLQTATQRLVAEFQPEQIWLFSSHAWGAPDEDSDVDLMIIVPNGDERSIKRMRSAHCCLRGIGFAKDVLVPTRAQVDRYKHLRASLFHQVLGLSVVVQNPQRHAKHQPVMPIEEHSQGIGLADPQLRHQLFVCAGLQAVGCHRNSLWVG